VIPPADVVVDSSTLIVAVAAILGTGGVASLVAFRKAGPESESISVTTLRGTVETLSGVVDEMRVELGRKDETIDRLNNLVGRQDQKIDHLNERIRQLEVDPPPHLG
jgi:hypothetical protein